MSAHTLAEYLADAYSEFSEAVERAAAEARAVHDEYRAALLPRRPAPPPTPPPAPKTKRLL